MTGESIIHEQVKLPLSVAVDVVLQGIRIRLGWSLVTIMGVTLGIAFLMSMLVGRLARQGVGREEQARAETRRMMSFLLAESGPLNGRVVGVVRTGAMNDVETRLVRAVMREKPKELREAATVDAVGDGATAILVVGDGPLPASVKGAKAVVAVTRQVASDRRVVQLSRQLRPDEMEAMAREQRRARFRDMWIVIISLAVTVIGISNSMLMSVTERFREIGTMKCLGALSSFIRRLFVIESTLVGTVGGLAGAVFGAVFAVAMYGSTYGFGMVLSSVSWMMVLMYAAGSVAVAVVLSMIAAIYPASFASRMVPATALRTNV